MRTTRWLGGVVLVLAGAASACGSAGGGDAGNEGGASDGASRADTAADAPPTPQGALRFWTTGLGQKVQPTTAPGAGAALTLATYRDAYVGGQLVVRAAGGHLDAVSATVSADLTDGSGHSLPRGSVVLYREGFVDFATTPPSIGTGNAPVPASSPTHDTRVPDPLVPLLDPFGGGHDGQPFSVAAESNQPLFVEVHVPRGLAAGTYTGAIRLSDASGASADAPLSVTVWGLDLPDMRSVTTHFKLSLNDLGDYYAGVNACAGGSCYLDTNNPNTRALIRRYEELTHAHRIDTGQALVDPPVNGCAPPTASEWAAYDAALMPYMTGSYFSDGVPSGRFDVPFSPGQDYGVDQSCAQAQYTALAAAWAQHLTQRGWFPRPAGGGFGALVYAYDEPLAASSDAAMVNAILNRVAQRSAWLQAGAAGTPSPWRAHVIDTTSPIAAPANPATTPLLDGALGVYVVSPGLYGPAWGHNYYGRTEWQSAPGLLNQGLELWFYESNSNLPPYPTFATNTLDGLEPTMLLWGSWFEHATGFLYWDTTYYTPEDPWGPNTRFGKTGDGMLLYPGNHSGTRAPAGSPAGVTLDGPVASYRLKMVRQGLQDWALFHLAETRGLRPFVEGQLGRVYRQLGGTMPAPAGSPYWNTDEAAMNEVRAAVVQRLLASP